MGSGDISTCDISRLKIQKSGRLNIKVRFKHYIILNEVIISVGSNVQIGYKLTKLWPSQDGAKVVARSIAAIE